MDFRSISLAAWTLLVNNILCASVGINCPQNILVLVFNYSIAKIFLAELNSEKHVPTNY